jgi:uncharacterized membrane protein YdjX (TVP38/TMEM64 family)
VSNEGGGGKGLVRGFGWPQDRIMSESSSRTFALRRIAPLGVIIAAGILFFMLGGQRYVTLDALAANREWLCALVAKGGIVAALGFIVIYAALVAMSVPGGAVLTITSGLLFGAWLGGAYALIAATTGATAVFLAARAGFSGLLTRAGPRLRRVESGFRENALSYLLAVRLMPIFPFWLVNLAAGVTGMKLSSYVLGTFFGMIPATFIFASLGSGIGIVLADGGHPDLGILFRPAVLFPIIGLAVLALLPVVYKRWRMDRPKA